MTQPQLVYINTAENDIVLPNTCIAHSRPVQYDYSFIVVFAVPRRGVVECPNKTMSSNYNVQAVEKN